MASKLLNINRSVFLNYWRKTFFHPEVMAQLSGSWFNLYSSEEKKTKNNDETTLVDLQLSEINCE